MFGSRFILTEGNDLSRRFLFSIAMKACVFRLMLLYWVSFQRVQCYACMFMMSLLLLDIRKDIRKERLYSISSF